MEIIFNQPLMLILLLFIPIMIVLHHYFFQHTKKKAMKFSNFAAMKRVTGTKLITKNTTQLILRSVIILFLILASSQPVIWYEDDVSEIDYIIAIDSSASMISKDVLPSRLEVAKQAAKAFLLRLDSKTKIGVISFSGVSFVKSHLTLDMDTVTSAINDVEIELTGGTDIGAALITSVNLLDTENSKSIILITDGSDTAGSFIDDSVKTALTYVTNNQVSVHTIAIGTGSSDVGYVDLNLPAVFDNKLLQEISEMTNGNYYEVETTAEMSAAFLDINDQSQKGLVSNNLSNTIFLLAFLLIMVEWYLLNTRFRSLP